MKKWLSDNINQKIYELDIRENKTQVEISKEIGISQQAVNKRIKKLKRMLNKQFPTNIEALTPFSERMLFLWQLLGIS